MYKVTTVAVGYAAETEVVFLSTGELGLFF